MDFEKELIDEVIRVNKGDIKKVTKWALDNIALLEDHIEKVNALISGKKNMPFVKDRLLKNIFEYE